MLVSTFIIDTARTCLPAREERRPRSAKSLNGSRSRPSSPRSSTAPWTTMTSNMLRPSRKNVIAACEASLKRFQTDYIDLYQPTDLKISTTTLLLPSRASSTTPPAGSAATTSTCCRRRSWTPWPREARPQPPAGGTAAANLLDRRAERESRLPPRPGCDDPVEPPAGGLLSGKYHRGEAPMIDSLRTWRTRWDNARLVHKQDVIEGIENLAAKAASMSQFSPSARPEQVSPAPSSARAARWSS